MYKIIDNDNVIKTYAKLPTSTCQLHDMMVTVVYR